MAGKRNPWGKSSSGGSGSGGGDSGDGDAPSGGKGSGNGGSDGPRNPWLPGGGGGGGNNGGRRGPNIEDIFKNRGPEGPRRGGGGGGGPTFRIPQRPGGKSWFPVALAAIAGVWVLATSLHIVDPSEKGFKTWFGGQYAGDMSDGLNFTAPWPIQTVDIENTDEIRRLTIGDGGGENLILTGDQNLVDLSYLVRWRVRDLVQYRFELEDPEDTLREAAESAMRAAVAETTLDNILSGEGRAQTQLRVRTRMQQFLDAYGAGIAVDGVDINRTEAPEAVIDAFNDVLAARQNREQLLNQARRYEQQLLAQAQGDAAQFNEIYEQYRLAPEVTRRRLYYETMETVLRGTDKTIIETDGVTPYLPLPEINQRARGASSLSASPQGGQ
ncbi:protease modulator HflK [Aurantiacibacter sediminis]|uniref:Protease modulator HflK n=1 Tax=Aurantiacibacter sediminis TaxID=2793064 RepID=A0ABS0N199_9SPHN|nr:protease modulator HflK [Aurantiacibacter sediminis]MBH5321693.1 protease modulator HflK [Aurantiacibacter sediminis]